MSEEKVYVLSTGRAGTGFLHRAFDRLDLGIKLAHQSRGSRRLNILGNLLYGCNNGSSHIGTLFRLLKSTEVPYSTADPLLSIPIAVYLRGRSISPGFRYKVIHLVRDPRDFVTSFMNWRQQKIKRMFLHHCVPFWQPSPIFFPEYSALSRFRMSKFEHYCWVWNFKNSLFRGEFENGYGYFLLRSEDLFSRRKGKATFERLLGFLGCSNATDEFEKSLVSRINPSRMKRFPGWRQWSRSQARTLHNHCGALMEHYGYGHEPLWLELLR